MPQRTKSLRKKLSPQLAQLKRFMETGVPWPAGTLEANIVYERQHDDTDGAPH